MHEGLALYRKKNCNKTQPSSTLWQGTNIVMTFTFDSISLDMSSCDRCSTGNKDAILILLFCSNSNTAFWSIRQYIKCATSSQNSNTNTYLSYCSSESLQYNKNCRVMGSLVKHLSYPTKINDLLQVYYIHIMVAISAIHVYTYLQTAEGVAVRNAIWNNLGGTSGHIKAKTFLSFPQ